MDDSRVDFGKQKKVSFFEIFKVSKFRLFFVNCSLFRLSSSIFNCHCRHLSVFASRFVNSLRYFTPSFMLHQTPSPSVGPLDLVLQFLSPCQSPVYVIILPLYHLVSTLSFCHAQYNAFITTTTTM